MIRPNPGCASSAFRVLVSLRLAGVAFRFAGGKIVSLASHVGVQILRRADGSHDVADDREHVAGDGWKMLLGKGWS
jgi:hypothetical protein